MGKDNVNMGWNTEHLRFLVVERNESTVFSLSTDGSEICCERVTKLVMEAWHDSLPGKAQRDVSGEDSWLSFCIYSMGLSDIYGIFVSFPYDESFSDSFWK